MRRTSHAKRSAFSIKMNIKQKPFSYISLHFKLILILVCQVEFKNKIVKYSSVCLAIGNFVWINVITILFLFTPVDIVLKSECLTIILNFFVATMFVIIIINYKDYIDQIIKRLEQNDEKLIELSNAYFFKFSSKILVALVLAELPYLLSSFVVVLYSDVKLGDPETLYITVYIPWKYDTPIKYTLALFYQVASFTYPVVLYFTLCFGLGSTHAFSNAELEILTGLICNLDRRDSSDIEINDDEYRRNIRNDFVEIIKYYKTYKCSLNRIANLLTFITDVIIFAVTACTIWDIANLIETEIQFARKIKSICVVVLMMSLLFGVCLMGEYIQEVDNGIRENLYNVSWYRKPIEIRKFMIMLMQYTQKPTQVRAYGMIPINLNFSLNLLRRIFAALNIYITVFRNRNN